MNRPAAFVDRDGTIIVEREYLADPGHVELIPGALDALHHLARQGYALIIVTNQSGIARGLYTEDQFHAVQQRLGQMLAADGVHIDRVYYCPHHPDFTGPCDCRKPAEGLFRRAEREVGIDLTRSLYIGDKLSDVAAASALGGIPVLVRTGYGAEEAARAPASVTVVEDLLAAARIAPRFTAG